MNSLFKPELENYHEKKQVGRRMNGKTIVAVINLVRLAIGNSA